MVAIRSMLTRVQQLEIEKAHPVLAKLGGEAGWAQLEADVMAGLAEGRYDSRDMHGVMASLARWLEVPTP